MLAGVPSSLPALIKANRIQEKAAHVGFDWEEPQQVWDKVKEEIAETEAEIKAGNKENMEAEFLLAGECRPTVWRQSRECP